MGRTAGAPQGPPPVATVLAPGLVLLGPQGVALTARALTVAADRAARDGIGLPPQARVLLSALLAAGSEVGTSGTCDSPDQAASAHDVADVAEVAEMLKVSREYACRLLRRGAFETGRKIAGRWVVNRMEVQAWRDERAEEARPA